MSRFENKADELMQASLQPGERVLNSFAGADGMKEARAFPHRPPHFGVPDGRHYVLCPDGSRS